MHILSHLARAIFTIPDAWKPDRTLLADYAGEDGWFAVLDTGSPTVEEGAEALGIVGTVPVFIDGISALRGTRDTGERNVSALVIPGETTTIALLGDDRHLEAIAASRDTDLGGMDTELHVAGALDWIEPRTLHRDAIDWGALRRHLAARREAGVDALMQHIADTIRAIGDGHNGYFPATTIAAWADWVPERIWPTVTHANGVGNVTIPAFSGPEAEGIRFTTILREGIAAAIAAGIDRWVVDLRGNTGGNMYPMIAGLAALFAPGPIMRFRNVNGIESTIAHDHDLAITYDGVPQAIVPIPAFAGARRSDDRVAVLVDGRTWSSGEATMIALASRGATRSFGTRTGGFVSSPDFLTLVDGAQFSLATVWIVDVAGRTHPAGIDPDVATDDFERAAHAWLFASE